MVKKELLKWIESEETAGYSPKKLSKYLAEKGYSKEQIKEAMDLADQEKKSEPQFEKIGKPKPKWLYIVLAVVLVIVIVAGTIAYLSPREKVVEENIDEPQEIVVVPSPDFPEIPHPPVPEELEPGAEG